VVRRLLLLGAVAMLLTGCGQSLDERAATALQDRVDAAHEHFLHVRALDVEPTGQAMLEQLDPWGYALRSRVVGDDVQLVWGASATVSETDGWFERVTSTRSLGACLGIDVRAGDGGDDRGSVWTEPVPCPEGVVISPGPGEPAMAFGDGEGDPSDWFTMDVDGHRDDVGPKPVNERSVCFSGDDCSEGGG
jgi:hypothetical protein